MPRNIVFCSSPSDGARELAAGLGVKRVRRPTSIGRRDSVINWGCVDFSRSEIWVFNNPIAVNNARKKGDALDILTRENVPCLVYFRPGTSRWSPGRTNSTSHTVYARMTETGCEGVGIRIIPPGGAMPDAPLFTQAFPTFVEYRVHATPDRVLQMQQKKKRNGANLTENDLLIRNHGRGWVFAVNDLHCDEYSYRADVEKVGMDAVKALGLDFGAVDILVAKKENGVRRIVVCEVNTRPGLESSSTLNAYVAYFKEVLAL